MILRIVEYPEEVLREKARAVPEITDEIRKLADDMLETMAAAKGVGLAANQVGMPLRIITVETGTEKEHASLVVINPEIVQLEGEDTCEEGCLSIPGFYELIKRAQKAKVKGIDLKGKTFTLECEGLLARAFQHEIDHLNGIVFIDHLSPIKKQLFKREYLKDKK
jgi:peptide deformylase